MTSKLETLTKKRLAVMDTVEVARIQSRELAQLNQYVEMHKQLVFQRMPNRLGS